MEPLAVSKRNFEHALVADNPKSLASAVEEHAAAAAAAQVILDFRAKLRVDIFVNVVRQLL
jgi:hypothetical protein